MNDASKSGLHHDVRLIESEAFPLEFVCKLAEIESWRKEIYRPIYHIHKWWANRLGSVFRAILIGSVLPPDKNLSEEFYRKHDFLGITVLDPFMGSGTTVGEAHKLGFISLGRDINPVACESARVAFGPLHREALLQAFNRLSSSVGERIRLLYQSHDSKGNVCDVLYYFWVKTIECPNCSKQVDLFPNYVFARNAYPNRKPDVGVYCPNCHDIFSDSVTNHSVQCPNCRFSFNPHRGPASGATAVCGACNRTFLVAKTVKSTGQPPSHRMFAKLILDNSGRKVYLPITEEDEKNYRKCSRALKRSNLKLPSLKLEDGYNTRQVINYAYGSWRQFFNDRQLLALGLLQREITAIPDESVRSAMLRVFSGTLEFNNMFASYKGEGTGAIRHMFAHHILKPERMPIEGNVWGTAKSSGAFSTLFKSRLLRSIDYRSAPFEITVEKKGSRGRRSYGGSFPFSGQVELNWPHPSRLSSKRIYLSCGSSSKFDFPAGSIDLIVTDPPFFDNVHYSELADFFFAWQKNQPSPFNRDFSSTRNQEEVQDADSKKFRTKLLSVFSECHRILKDNGLFVFTYHHSRSEGWIALAEAVMGSGFAFINCHPVKSEMSVATPKSQAKEPIQIDTIFVCRKKAIDTRPKSDFSVALDRAIELSEMKATRLQNAGFSLSLNDRRVILLSQFLVEACPQRSIKELSDALSESISTLDSSALNLAVKINSGDMRIIGHPKEEGLQRTLFEKPVVTVRE